MHIFVCWQILDFGLARATDQEMTGYVATRYWRAPEIMLNWMHYGRQGGCGMTDVDVEWCGHDLCCIVHQCGCGLCWSVVD